MGYLYNRYGDTNLHNIKNGEKIKQILRDVIILEHLCCHKQDIVGSVGKLMQIRSNVMVCTYFYHFKFAPVCRCGLGHRIKPKQRTFFIRFYRCATSTG